MHPSDTDLEAYLAGSLPPTQASDLEQHFSVCRECAEKAERTRAPVPSDTPSVPHEPAGEVPAGLRGNPKYQPVCLLGEGGMGSVWLAEHAVMGRRVAIKLIRPEYLARPGALDRFRREARAVAKLQHANVVAAYDADEADGVHFLVMEYVPGENLGDVLKKGGPFPVPEAVKAARDVALGLAAAHDVGLTHRDIKPGNLIRTAAGRTKILDFGLATAGADGGDLTGENVVMGTPDYIAPEQAVDARTADGRADLYSLGCTLYALLTGSVPFPVAGTLKKLDAHRLHSPKPLRLLRPEASEKLAAVVARLMAKRPDDRYQSAMEAAEALEACRKLGMKPEAEVPREDPDPPRRKPRWLLLIPVTLVAAMVIAAVGGLRNAVNEEMAGLVNAVPDLSPTKPTAAAPVVPPTTAPAAKPPVETVALRELYALEGVGAKRLAAAEGGLWLCAGTGATIRRQANGEVVRDLGVTNVAAAAWSAGGVIALASDDSGKVHVVEAADGKEAHAFGPYEKGRFEAMAFGGGPTVVFAAHAGRLHRLDVFARRDTPMTPVARGEFAYLAPSPDGTRLAFPEFFPIKGHPRNPFYGGTLVRVVRQTDGSDAGQVKPPNPNFINIVHAAWAADGKTLFALYAGGYPAAYRWPEGTELLPPVGPGHPSAVRIEALPGGDLLATAGGDGFVRLWDARTGAKRAEARATDGRLVGMAAAPDAALLFTADHLGTAKAWAVERSK